MGEEVCDCGARQHHPSVPPGTVRHVVCPKCGAQDADDAYLDVCPKCGSSEWHGDQERDGRTCGSCGHHATLDELDAQRCGVRMFTAEEDQMFREGEGRGDCKACYGYSGYNRVKCSPKKTKQVRCDVLRVKKEIDDILKKRRYLREKVKE